MNQCKHFRSPRSWRKIERERKLIQREWLKTSLTWVKKQTSGSKDSKELHKKEESEETHTEAHDD